jgi:hypothetical protein
MRLRDLSIAASPLTATFAQDARKNNAANCKKSTADPLR